jgi:hypothetical protein
MPAMIAARATVFDLILVGAVVVSAPSAGAQTPPETATVGSGGAFEGALESDDNLSATVTYDVAAGVHAPSGGSAGPAAARRASTCEVYATPGGPLGEGTENMSRTPVGPGGLAEGEWYYTSCRYDDNGELDYAAYWQYTPADPANPGPDLEALARRAYDQVPLTFPVPRTSPAIDLEQITGLPTWLWVDPASWRPVSARAELAGFWVEVTAEPRRVTWNMGDGTVVQCDGPGTAYDLSSADDAQSTDCDHVYQVVSAEEPAGRYLASARMTWAVTWRASTGAAGVLADASRTTTFDLVVSERQAVVTYDP